MLRKVLVVDSDAADRDALCDALHGHFDLTEAGDMQTAARLLALHCRRLSAIVLVIGRFAAEALPLIDKLRTHAIYAQPPVLVLARETNADEEYSILSAGANDYVSRYATVAIIRRRISNLIRLREMSAIGNDFSHAKQTSERLKAIMDHVAAGITAITADKGQMRLLFSNDRFYEMFGYTRESYTLVVDSGFNPILEEDQGRVHAAMQRIRRSGDAEVLEYRAVCSGGEIIWVRHYITMTRFMGVPEAVQLGVLYDITSERRAYAASQAKSAFLSRLCHDMRTPMNAITGLVNLAADEDNPPRTREYLDNVRVASQYLLELIGDELDLSKIESGKLELHETPYPAEEFVRHIETMIVPLMEQKKLRFTVTANCGMANIVVDRLRFNQIFTNLLSNAVKYTPEGGQVELIADAIPDKGGKHGMRFTVRDNGIGMGAEFMKHVFEPFTQENRSVDAAAASSGLGLAIVKNIVEQMGGSIRAESEPGRGTAFTVDLYAFEATPADISREKRSQAPDSLEGVHVLLAEDNAMNMLVIQRQLEKKGCLVTPAVNGREAVEAFAASETGGFDIVLMDRNMPVMNGLEAARQIRAMDRPDAGTLPIIEITADAFTDNSIKSLEAGMSAHLVKPIDPERLFDVIAEMLMR